MKNIKIFNPKCYLDEQIGISKETAIYGYDESTAQIYAEKFGNKFISLDDDESEDDNERKVILTPANDSDYRDTIIDGKTVINLETKGTLEISSDNVGSMLINKYTIYGNGKAQYNGKEYDWSDLGIEIVVGQHDLEISVPDLDLGKVEIGFYDDFLKIDGMPFNTYSYETDELVNPWSFNLLPDTDNSFSFKNTKMNDISKDLISKLFTPSQVNKIYKKKVGNGGVCFGMALANAGMTYGSFLELSDFEGDYKKNWDIPLSAVNKSQNLSLSEFIQICQTAQHLPSVVKIGTKNMSKGNNKKPDKIESLVNSVKKFIDTGGSDPVIIFMTSDANEYELSYHAVFAYDCIEDKDKITLIVYDPNKPGREQKFYSIKKIILLQANGIIVMFINLVIGKEHISHMNNH